MEWLTQVTQSHRKANLPEFGPGDQIRVWYRIVERDRVRLAPFEGIVIRRRGAGISATFTVRRLTHGEGVERVFPLHAPIIDRVEIIQQSNPRRARLYFLRRKIGKTRLAPSEAGGQTASPSAAPEAAAAATALSGGEQIAVSPAGQEAAPSRETQATPSPSQPSAAKPG
jgi:large subunit ribosomal protein L19